MAPRIRIAPPREPCMPVSTTTIMLPSKVALSRHERFLESACRACRVSWGGMAIFVQDGLLRDHLINGLSTKQAIVIRNTSTWTDALRIWSTSASHQCGTFGAGHMLPGLPPVGACLAVSWPIHGQARVVIYVVR